MNLLLARTKKKNTLSNLVAKLPAHQCPINDTYD